MGRPQDNRLQRSGNTPIDPDHIQTEVETQPHAPRDEPGGGPVPHDQQPGHHPPTEQDKPDLDAFAERLGIRADDESDADESGADDADGRGDDAARDDADRTKADRTKAAGSEPDREASGSNGPLGAVRAVAATAVGLAEPVAHLVQGGVGRAARLFDERRHLVERVERLEAQVAELTDQLSVERTDS